MRVNARFDEAHANKLSYLQRATGASVSDIMKDAIDALYEQMQASSGDAAKVLAESGFIGCADGPAELSADYKAALGRALAAKHDHR